jgi:hypothetical protein
MELPNSLLKDFELVCRDVNEGKESAKVPFKDMLTLIVLEVGSWEEWLAYPMSPSLKKEFAWAAVTVFDFSEVEDELQVYPLLREVLTADLLKQGLELGKDFSIVPNGIITANSKATEAIKKASPAWFCDNIKMASSSKEENPWEKLEEHLGVPFRERLGDRLVELFREGHDTSVLMGWISIVSYAVTNRVEGKPGYSLIFHLTNRLEAESPGMESMLEAKAKRGEFAREEEMRQVGIEPIIDVLLAAGACVKNGEVKMGADGQPLFNTKAVQRLSLVWQFPGQDTVIESLIKFKGS